MLYDPNDIFIVSQFKFAAKQDAEPPPESENCDLDLSGIDDDEIDGVSKIRMVLHATDNVMQVELVML